VNEQTGGRLVAAGRRCRRLNRSLLEPLGATDKTLNDVSHLLANILAHSRRHVTAPAAPQYACTHAVSLMNTKTNYKLRSFGRKKNELTFCAFLFYEKLLQARLMGHYCFARWRLSASSVVVCNAAGGWAGRRVRGRSGGRHCTAGQYGYVPLGRHLLRLNMLIFTAHDEASAVYAVIVCLSVRPSVRLSVRHTRVLYQNG